MIIRTRGLVLGHMAYKEQSIICKVYTEELGTKSFIIHNVRSKRNSSNAIFLQPLTLVELEIYGGTKGGLNRIKEHAVARAFKTIPFNQVKRAVTFFVTEVLEKCLKEEHENHDLFRFLWHSIELFDEQEHNSENFHIFMLLYLSKHLGFFPHEKENQEDQFFDLLEGKYCYTIPSHPHYLNMEEAAIWSKLSEAGEQLLFDTKLERGERQIMIANLLAYFKLHVANFNEIVSYKILQQLFD